MPPFGPLISGLDQPLLQGPSASVPPPVPLASTPASDASSHRSSRGTPKSPASILPPRVKTPGSRVGKLRTPDPSSRATPGRSTAGGNSASTPLARDDVDAARRSTPLAVGRSTPVSRTREKRSRTSVSSNSPNLHAQQHSSSHDPLKTSSTVTTSSMPSSSSSSLSFADYCLRQSLLNPDPLLYPFGAMSSPFASPATAAAAAALLSGPYGAAGANPMFPYMPPAMAAAAALGSAGYPPLLFNDALFGPSCSMAMSSVGSSGMGSKSGETGSGTAVAGRHQKMSSTATVSSLGGKTRTSSAVGGKQSGGSVGSRNQTNADWRDVGGGGGCQGSGSRSKESGGSSRRDNRHSRQAATNKVYI